MVLKSAPEVFQPFLMPAFALVSLFLLAGCVLYDYRTGQPVTDLARLNLSNSTLNLSAGNICSEIPGPDPCYCMVCRNKSTSYWLWYDSSLKEGECRFDKCNSSSFLDILKNGQDKNGQDVQPRYFMLGNGPSFASTKIAFPYCSQSLQIATRWVKAATPGSPPRRQTPARAACWLERNFLPVYIYHTNGTAIDPGWMGNFAKSLADAKAYPSIIVTEVHFNSSSDADVSAVKQQIVAIKRNCPKCLSVLGVSSQDTKAVNKVLGDPAQYLNGKNMSELIDMVGFGFLANDYNDCNPPRILGANIQFSRFILMNYSKPTLWLYVGASEGNNTGGNCYFTNQTVHDFYQKVFASIPGLVSSGVVGMSFYEVADRTGPLPCAEGQGCDYGVFDINGSQKHPEMNSWSSLCQFVANDNYRNPAVFSRNGRGFVCDVFQNWNIYTQISTEVNTELGLKTAEVVPMPNPAGVRLTCGEVLISGTVNPVPNIYDSTGNTFSPAHCDKFPDIEEYSDDLEVSSTYMRALIEQESSFNTKSRSCEPISNDRCNTGRLVTGSDIRSYYKMSEICGLAGIAPSDCPAECPSGQKPCAFGLAQCIDYPGKHYSDAGVPLSDLPSWITKCGGYGYNPFNPKNSICCGVNEYAVYLQEAQDFLNANWGELSKCDNGMKDAEKPWAAYYLASNRYYGADSYATGSGSAFSHFLSQRDLGTGCSGTQHYISYLRIIKQAITAPSKDPRNEYGAQEMSRYYSAVSVCGTDGTGK